MTIAQTVSQALRRFGEKVRLQTKEGDLSAYAMIQPLRRKHRLYLNEERKLSGLFDGSYRHYIGEPVAPLNEGDEVICREGTYAVLIAERYYSGAELLYIWAVLKPKRERTDDYEEI